MNTAQIFLKNASALLLAQFSSLILVFVYQIYIIRYLGAEGFGVISFAIAFTAICGVATDFGTSDFAVRELAKDRTLTEKFTSNLVTVKAVFVTVVLISIVGVTGLLGYPQNIASVIYIFALSVCATTFASIFSSVFQAYERMEYVAAGSFLQSALILISVVFVVHYSLGTIGISLAYLFASVVALIYAVFIYVYKFARLHVAADWTFIRSTVVTAIPFGLLGVFTTIYFWADSVILGGIQGPEAVGWYVAAYKFIQVFLSLLTVLNVAIFPVMAKFYMSSPQALEKVRDKYFKFLLMVSLPTAVLVTLLADRLVVLVLGLDYVQSIIALQILIWALVFSFMGATFIRLFESTNNQGLVAKLIGFVLVENIILNVFMITRFSYVGAAITELISDLTLFCLLFYFSYRLDHGIEKQTFLVTTSKIAFASAVVGVCIWALRALNLIILLIFGVLLYLVVLYLIKGIDHEDIELLKQLPVFSQRNRTRP